MKQTVSLTPTPPQKKQKKMDTSEFLFYFIDVLLCRHLTVLFLCRLVVEISLRSHPGRVQLRRDGSILKARPSASDRHGEAREGIAFTSVSYNSLL
jgi:hypothetical protein